MPAAEERVLGECGGKSFVEDDMIRFMQQRAGRRARISAVATRLLTEEGDLTGRRLPRIDRLEPVGYRQKAREETAQLLKSSRKSRAEAADHDVWDPEAQWAHFPNCVVHEDGMMYLPTEQEREQALSLVLADARRGEPAPTAVGDVGDAAVCVMPVEVALARCVQRDKTRHMCARGVRSVHVRDLLRRYDVVAVRGACLTCIDWPGWTAACPRQPPLAS